MRIYIAAHFNNFENITELNQLNSIIQGSGCEIFNFVTTYTEPFKSNREMMDLSKAEIAKSDIFLVDVTEKSNGRMIETGIAYTLDKKIIMICKTGTFVKDTLKGVSDLIIEYDNIDDIKAPLTNYIKSLKQ